MFIRLPTVKSRQMTVKVAQSGHTDAHMPWVRVLCIVQVIACQNDGVLNSVWRVADESGSGLYYKTSHRFSFK